jgi:hypothetical protein
MDECPQCKKYLLSYIPFKEELYCYGCGYTKKEGYDEHINRKDCSKNLLYPSSSNDSNNRTT